MAMIYGHERLTVGEMMIELSGSDPDMIVVAIGDVDGKFIVRSIYKTEETADEKELCLYMDTEEFPRMEVDE